MTTILHGLLGLIRLIFAKVAGTATATAPDDDGDDHDGGCSVFLIRVARSMLKWQEIETKMKSNTGAKRHSTEPFWDVSLPKMLSESAGK